MGGSQLKNRGLQLLWAGEGVIPLDFESEFKGGRGCYAVPPLFVSFILNGSCGDVSSQNIHPSYDDVFPSVLFSTSGSAQT